MTAFKRIAYGVDVEPTLAELAMNPIPPGHVQLTNYGFRMLQGPFPDRPCLSALLTTATSLVPGALIGAILNVTPPGGVLAPHRDLLPDNVQRYHVVIANGPMAVMKIGKERKKQKAGEIWALNLRHRIHEVRNHDTVDRVILILDAAVTQDLFRNDRVRSAE
ncbi:MAG: aspartyl/asparaginyl beta-hydroxylase domain-containing protein [Blastomonas sp.]|uniref:aspartyl/asparaginyl beta-hydroxylase domain-containing protein n=1 Tax=Blastomonas sp. TaxID=1909299 RepID=UPI003BC70803|nr:aspartyl/asparaginyl beta-hydroxylase domain-containing protein [Blastomonas sp.]